MPTLKTPWDVLLPYQREVFDDGARFKIWLASRQIGKSMTGAAEIVRDCFSSPGVMWVVLSAGERQALEFMEKVKAWVAACGVALDSYFEERDGPETLIKSAEARVNKSRVLALPANPNTARGYSANVFLDEFAFHDDPRPFRIEFEAAADRREHADAHAGRLGGELGEPGTDRPVEKLEPTVGRVGRHDRQRPPELDRLVALDVGEAAGHGRGRGPRRVDPQQVLVTGMARLRQNLAVAEEDRFALAGDRRHQR